MSVARALDCSRLDLVARRGFPLGWLVAGGAVAAVYALAVGPYLYSDDWCLFQQFETGALGSFGSGTWLGLGAGFYRPVASLSLLADLWLFGFDARALHLVNAALFTLCALAVGRLAAMLARPRAGVAAVAATLLCLVHPAAVESVSWLSCRTNLLSGLFTLLTCLAAIRFARRGTVGSLGIAAAMFALALLSKEDALVALPAACLLSLSARRTRRVLALAAVLTGVAALCLAMRAGAGVGLPRGDHAAFFARGPLALVQRLLAHLHLLFWPVLDSTPTAFRAAGFLGLAVTVIVGVAGRNRLAIGLLSGALLIGLLPGVQSDIDLVMGVRLIFISFLLAATLLGVLAANSARWARLGVASTGVLLITFGAASADNLGRWKESGRFSARVADALLELHAAAAPEEVFILVDAPLDCRGAPTFEYRVYYILRPPFTRQRRMVILHQAEVVREAIQKRPESGAPRPPARVLAWLPGRGLVHAPIPAGGGEALRSWRGADLAAWQTTGDSGGVRMRSPAIGIAAVAIDRIEVAFARPPPRPPILRVVTALDPGGVRLDAVADGGTWTFPFADVAFRSPADRVDRLELRLAGVSDREGVRSIRLLRFPRRFDLTASLERSEAGLVLRLRIPRPDSRWRKFRLELFTQEASISRQDLGREAFTDSPDGAIECRTTLHPDDLERMGVRSGALFFFRIQARREDGSGRARSRVAKVQVP